MIMSLGVLYIFDALRIWPWRPRQFYQRQVLAFRYCRCLRACVHVCMYVCVSINHELVRAITHQPFKPEPPNVDKNAKQTNRLRSLFLFMCYNAYSFFVNRLIFQKLYSRIPIVQLLIFVWMIMSWGVCMYSTLNAYGLNGPGNFNM